MKTTTIALFTALVGLTAATAKAESRVFAGSRFAPTASIEYCPPPVTVVTPAYAPPMATRFEAPRGFWKDVTVKSWVPDRWNITRNRWGHTARVLEPGHYAFNTSRVWVDGRHDDYRNGRRG